MAGKLLRYLHGDARGVRLEHLVKVQVLWRGGQAQANEHAVAVLFDEVEVVHNGGILREDADRPAGLREDRREAAATDVVLLGFRRPCAHDDRRMAR
jgi:hypothetical protein